MYIEIDGKQYPCEVKTSITQMGNTLIRVISDDAPVAKNGFVLISGDNTFDKSTFKYLYRMDGNVKEYTEVAEEIIPASGYVSGVPENPLAKQLSAMNQRINKLEPYKETKTAYYGEKEKRFYGVPSGVVTVFFDKYDGEYTVSRMDDVLTVSFPALANETNITIMIQ